MPTLPAMPADLACYGLQKKQPLNYSFVVGLNLSHPRHAKECQLNNV